MRIHKAPPHSGGVFTDRRSLKSRKSGEHLANDYSLVACSPLVYLNQRRVNWNFYEREESMTDTVQGGPLAINVATTNHTCTNSCSGCTCQGQPRITDGDAGSDPVATEDHAPGVANFSPPGDNGKSYF